MARLREFTLMVITGGVLLILLSYLPESSWKGGTSLLPVYQSLQDTSEEALVHFLVHTPFGERIKKVQLTNNRLLLDFSSPSLPERKTVLHDLSRLVDGGFSSLPLKEIWVRVLAQREGEEELVVGLMAERAKFQRGIWKEGMGEEELLASLQEHYQLTYGLLWSLYEKRTPAGD
ncbi:hypothetical protein [Thermicanus aegyptius]|uniref:hypothetical protein n=1 Tax=Thermicanus aegyptius TaxID=94009 RepID=UPI0004911C71|nr:hypothetical protein [Thermicanus aegyptius]